MNKIEMKENQEMEDRVVKVCRLIQDTLNLNDVDHLVAINVFLTMFLEYNCRDGMPLDSMEEIFNNSLRQYKENLSKRHKYGE